MQNFIFGKTQSQTIAQTIYGDIEGYCDKNFERYIKFYREELTRAKGKPIEEITIRFTPMPYLVGSNPTESGGGCNE